MNLLQIIEKIIHQIRPFESISSFVIFILFIVGTVVQISPIKINPWDFLLGWIGERFNSGINKKVEQLEKKIDQHIESSKNKDLKQQRQYIISFVDEGVNGKRHTKESFQNAIRACDAYEKFIRQNNIKNGVIVSSISAIRLKYEQHLINADFATGEHYVENVKQTQNEN